ncbi:TrgA family protein [Sulfitobacter sp. JBTF-M27]|uniref:TrgA family protein n=1 Tax=Sulfitobacter sediminilitoris TaxID=2698830 RepID=A0A6P0C6B6_9RHOB|nr:TrgA family protein [Sulfitobacter sediminilitoris]NEK20795.1 TrgA family protein [Sulfitobacter sediminilitoris]
MPTAARLMAAICLAIVACIISFMVMPLMPESTDFGYFVPLNIVLGLLVGWIVMGRRAGRGTTAAINNGLTGVFVLMLWGIGVQAINEMMRLAMRNRYDGPFEAIVAIFKIGAEFAVIIATVEIGIALLISAVISGLLTEFASKRWR